MVARDTETRRPGQRVVDVAVCLLVAALLVGAATYVRSLLTPELGRLSPFMLYVAAVVLAGLLRGALCGLFVMLGGGLCGLFLFLSPGASPSTSAYVALAVFWAVSALVLLVSNELRLGLKATMDKVRALATRRGPGVSA
jgi:K+-sensing histidine kinase KdpD